jgi:acyl carrier protein/2-polyprenyl-3-methyl-5-hydroxy-6-metoxy-1,4-benzoquinol methylase
MRQQAAPLAGTGLLQSPEEWAARGQALVAGLSDLIGRHRDPQAAYGLDVGCQQGGLVDLLSESTGLIWAGIDPVLTERRTTSRGAGLGPGQADAIPFPDNSFDVVVLANVFEHILPEARQSSMNEIYRVLRPGGILVGQIPNPYFPIESHSRLPLMGFLPISWQRRYWRMSPVPWPHDFYVVTMRHLRRHATSAGLRITAARSFNYPADAIPRRVRALSKAAAPIMRVYPWAWQFVMTKPARGGDDSDLSAKIVDFVVAVLDGEVEAADLLGQPPLTLTEALDSMALMELATFLEDEFQIEIPDDELTRDNFATVADVTRFVQMKLTKILLPPPRVDVGGTTIRP